MRSDIGAEYATMRVLALLVCLALLSCGGAASDVSVASSVAPSVDSRVTREEPLGELPRAEPEVMPEGVPRWAVASGWGDTHFVARTDDDRVDVVVGGEATELVGEIEGPRALAVDGGRLVVATTAGIVTIDLRSREREPLASATGVTSLAVDHVGYYIASRSDGPPLRVTPEGEATTLDGVAAGPIAFDPSRRELFVVDEAGDRVQVYDYVRVVGEDPAVWAERDARRMRSFTIDGIGLTSAEYWPNRGETPTRYPDDVLWGFYPERGVVIEGAAAAASATDAAVACAEESYDALRAFIADPPDGLRQAIGLGTSNRFYLWVNDYSEAADPFPHEMRPNRFWYWQHDPAVTGRIPGYWKWETTLTQGGECLVPERAQAEAYLAEKLAELGAATP